MDVREKLQREVASTDWRSLGPHQERGALLICAAELDLVDVALVIATDRAHILQHWLAAGLVYKAGEAHAEVWADGVTFDFVIVQPWVIAKPRGADA